MQFVPPAPSQLALRSTATPYARSSPIDPIRFDQTWAPLLEYFATTTSSPPKSADPVKAPVITTSPRLSTARLSPMSAPAPPKRFAHGTPSPTTGVAVGTGITVAVMVPVGTAVAVRIGVLV